MPVSETFRTVVLVFLGTHMPATLMMDSQALLPSAIVPGFDKNRCWISTCGQTPIRSWRIHRRFKSFILFELLFQLPFFFIDSKPSTSGGTGSGYRASSTGRTRRRHSSQSWLRFYIRIVFPDEAAWKLMSIYTPYLLVPASMAYALGVDDKPFGAKGGPNKLKIF